jgi:ribosomal protein S6
MAQNSEVRRAAAIVTTRIAEIVKTEQVSRYRLATVLGRPRNAVYDSLRVHKLPNVINLLKWAVALNRDVNDLIRDVNSEYDQMRSSLTSPDTTAVIQSESQHPTREGPYAEPSGASSRVLKPGDPEHDLSHRQVETSEAKATSAHTDSNEQGPPPNSNKAGVPKPSHAGRLRVTRRNGR